MSVFQSNGVKIHYDIKGAGESIVLLHGFALDSRLWRSQVDFLTKEGYQVVTYDLRGFGQSSMPTEGVKYSHSDDLKALLDHLKVSKAHLVGISFGGEVAIDFALDHSEYVESLSLLGSSLSGFGEDKDSPIPRWMRMAKNDKEVEVRSEILTHQSFRSLEGHREAVKLVKQMLDDYSLWHFKFYDPVVRGDANSKLEGVKCSTLVFVGENESDCNREIATYINSEVEDSSFVVVAGAGHFINLERADEINKGIAQFTHEVSKELLES